MTAPGRVPALLCIDVEPDARVVPMPDAPPWEGASLLLERVEEIRASLAEASGRPARFGWFLRMDPQVAEAYGDPRWVARHHGDALARVAAVGDELGLHTHSWRWTGDGWLSDQADAGWVRHCADVSFDAFEDAFGAPCRAYRHGDRFMTDDLARHVAAWGVRVDLTLEPGEPEVTGLAEGEATTGVIPAVPEERAGIHHTGHHDLVAVPLTTAPGLGSSTGTGTLVLWTPPRLFAAKLATRVAEDPPAHLAFAIRSDCGTDDVAWSFITTNLRHVADVFGPDVEWVTAADVSRPDAAASAATRRPRGAGTRALRSYGGELERALHHAEVHLAVDRARDARDRAAAEAALAELGERLGALEERLAVADAERAILADELAELRSTVTWRAHDRLLPVLRRIRSVLPPRV